MEMLKIGQVKVYKEEEASRSSHSLRQKIADILQVKKKKGLMMEGFQVWWRVRELSSKLMG